MSKLIEIGYSECLSPARSPRQTLSMGEAPYLIRAVCDDHQFSLRLFISGDPWKEEQTTDTFPVQQ